MTAGRGVKVRGGQGGGRGLTIVGFTRASGEGGGAAAGAAAKPASIAAELKNVFI